MDLVNEVRYKHGQLTSVYQLTQQWFGTLVIYVQQWHKNQAAPDVKPPPIESLHMRVGGEIIGRSRDNVSADT